MTPRPRALRVRARLAIAAVLGVACAVALSASTAPFVGVSAGLAGFVLGVLLFVVPLLVEILRVDGPATAAYVEGLDPTVSETDLVAIVSGLGALGGAAVMLLGGSAPATGGGRLEAVLAVAAVACAWLLLHTMYTLRYARHWYNAEPGCITFSGEDTPRFSDFAYFAFGLGMAYQVSDTDLHGAAIRRIVLFHTLASYVFGTVIIAVTINLVAGLAGSGG